MKNRAIRAESQVGSSRVLPLIAVLLVFGTVAWFLLGNDVADIDETVAANGSEVEEAVEEKSVATDAASRKEGVQDADASARTTLTDDTVDPLYARAMAGFRGRLVFSDGKPAADKAVRFVRGDPEAVPFPHVFSGEDRLQLLLEMYETRSGADGRFEVTGVWPQAFYLLVADVAGENQRVKVVENTPGPGEIVDLGDIALLDLGIISGRVIDDEDGEPVVGALVRAADIPGIALNAVPAHRFDPEGGLIVDERGFKFAMTMPPVVKTLFDLLPIPTTRTDSDGAFRLTGVQPGINTVVVNKKELLPLLENNVRVKPGREKKLRKPLRMREGEFASGRVLDTEDQPVPGIEVLVASKNLGLPVHFASFAKPTDAKGSFEVAGMAPGSVYAAVRRSAKEAWVVTGPFSVAGDMTLRLPAQHTLSVRVKSALGQAPDGVEFKIVCAPAQNGRGFILGALGLIEWIDLAGRVARGEDGSYRIEGLNPGDYTVAIRAKDHAAAKLNVKVTADVSADVTLHPALTVGVKVIDSDNEPVRNAKIYAHFRGENFRDRVQNFPLFLGKTDRQGEFTFREANKGNVRLTAAHPFYGLYHAKVTLPTDEQIVITVQQAGVITGTLLDGGKPAKPGKWMILLERNWQETRGALPTMPRISIPDLEGVFRIRGLAPGNYRVQCTPSVGGAGSPGGIMKLAKSSMGHGNRENVHVRAGAASHVMLEASGKQEVTGPAVSFGGTVMINGRPGKGLVVTGWSWGGKQSVRLRAEVDDAGRFDLGRVPVGQFNMQLKPSVTSEFHHLLGLDGELWSLQGKVEEGKDQQFDLTLHTGSIAGVVVDGDGNPARSMELQARGMIKAMLDRPKSKSRSRASTVTDAAGRFTFPSVVAGEYTVSIRGVRGYAESGKLQVQSGLPVTGVRLQTEKVYTVKGRVDLSVYPTKPGWIHIQFHTAKGRRSRGGMVDVRTGEFEVRGLTRGTYQARISNWQAPERYRQASLQDPLEVSGDVDDVKIRPKFKQPKPPKKKSG